MEISRLTFTKETKEKMEKPMSHFKRGELRWQKLQELDESGKLGTAKNRQDITSMMGLGTGYGTAYSWVSHLITGGYIKEILSGFDSNNRPEYEYHLVKKPNYKNKTAKPTTKKESKVMTPEVKEDKAVSGKVFAVPTNEETKMVIKYKELTIEIYNSDKKED